MKLSSRIVLRPAPGSRWKVTAGVLWATRPLDPVDHLFVAGASVTFDGCGWVVTSLDGSAEFQELN